MPRLPIITASEATKDSEKARKRLSDQGRASIWGMIQTSVSLGLNEIVFHVSNEHAPIYRAVKGDWFVSTEFLDELKEKGFNVYIDTRVNEITIRVSWKK